MSKVHHSMRRFNLVRNEDETGISGEGVIAEGVEFSNGQVALHWLTYTSCSGFYQNIKQVTTIHGHGGKTVVQWIDVEDVNEVE